MIYRLGIDLGATNTAAAVSLDGAPAQALRLAAERVELPSVLYVTSDGALLLGSEASTQAASDPFRAVSDPVRRLADDLPAFDDGIQHVAAADAVAAILTYVVEAATREHGGPPAATMVSQPAGWDDYQRSCLVRATAQADLPNCRLVPDVAAAARGVVARADPGPDAQFLVVDLGGGSCTAALAQRTSTGVEVIDHICAPHPSGDDFDEAVFRLVGGSLGDHGRELTSDDPAARARAVEVRRACRQAKEILSSSPEASVTVGMPGFSKTVTLARDEFESLIRPNLRDGLAMATQLLNRNPVPVDQLVGVALVGGASRMPIVAELVRREFDLPVVISDEPELEIALGLVSPEGGSSPPAAVLDPPAAVLVPPAAVLVPPAAVLVPVGDVSPDRAASSGPTAPA
ncbi:MAG: Hsp70 family protein, partial [Microlunatus sp.]|nr:Hsp70 family protein [Microlunatus sp.]